MMISLLPPRCRGVRTIVLSLFGYILLAGLALRTVAAEQQPIRIVISPEAAIRVRYGAEHLRNALVRQGAHVEIANGRPVAIGPRTIAVGIASDGPLFRKTLEGTPETQQAFALKCGPDSSAVIAGLDESGALYGCLELAERIDALGTLPPDLTFHDAPKLLLRGPCIGLQRPEITYDGVQYDCRYLPETFPWLYDRDLWVRFLDLLARHRFNALYLWNGHPFTSILRLPKYPEAQEVDTPQLDANIELYRWLCTEADRRGIWVVQMFYNIHLSHPFARKHRIPLTHGKPSRLVSEYTACCVSEFVRDYPHVGLMMCLGEALQDKYDAAWLTDVIIPAVKAGMKPGQPLPPIIVRSHSTPIFDVLAKARPLYDNIYTEAKYNNETLASDQVGGGTNPDTSRHYPWETGGQGHRRLAEKSFLVTNVHCVANLEPFRWGSPDFIRRAMTSCVETGVKGLHLYPPRYWEWPYTADRAEPRLLQPERDWIWFAVWARYSWNPYRNVSDETAFWTRELAERYGSPDAGQLLLEAYQHSGEVMPQTTRAFAITTENYLANTLGQTLEQLFESRRWYAPPGETIAEYAERQAAGKQHAGQTPLMAARSMLDHAEAALKSAEGAEPLVTRNRDEFARLLNDVRAIRLVAQFYAEKVEAAVAGLLFLHKADVIQLDRCETLLGRSVETYRRLTVLTDRRYLDCAGRHDPGRRYPYPAPRYLVWSQVLPEFENELAIVKENANLIRKETAPLRTPDRRLTRRFFTHPLSKN